MKTQAHVHNNNNNSISSNNEQIELLRAAIAAFAVRTAAAS